MPSDHDENAMLTDDLSKLFDQWVQVEMATKSQFDGATLWTVEMSYFDQKGTGDEAASRFRICQHAVFLQDEQFELPHFCLAAKRSGLHRMLSTMFGSMGSIRFDEPPTFSQNHVLQSIAEPVTRQLFTLPLRHHLANNLGWSAVGKGRMLAVFRHNQTYDNATLVGFVKDALAIIELIQACEVELELQPSACRDRTNDDLASASERVGGGMGAILETLSQSGKVTKQELDHFLKQAPPRQIPFGLGQQAWGISLPLIAFGLPACFLASIFAGGIYFLAEDASRWYGIAIAGLIAVSTAALVVLATKHVYRKRRTLRSGCLVEGRVIRVNRDHVGLNHTMCYRIVIELNNLDHSGTVECLSYEPGATKAQCLMEHSQPVRVFIDPQDVSHVVCLDFMHLPD